jgi:hypothetical protein
MTLDLDKLAALAKAATPGPWEWLRSNMSWGGQPCVLDANGALIRFNASRTDAQANAAFVAACDPTTVLALIESQRKLKRDFISACDELRHAREQLIEYEQLAMERSARD